MRSSVTIQCEAGRGEARRFAKSKTCSRLLYDSVTQVARFFVWACSFTRSDGPLVSNKDARKDCTWNGRMPDISETSTASYMLMASSSGRRQTDIKSASSVCRYCTATRTPVNAHRFASRRAHPMRCHRFLHPVRSPSYFANASCDQNSRTLRSSLLHPNPNPRPLLTASRCRPAPRQRG